MNVILQRDVLLSSKLALAPDSAYEFQPGQADDLAQLARAVDLVVALGGDGTLLYVSSLFSRHVPPVVCFSMGSLGFLMPFGARLLFPRAHTPRS